MWACSCLCTDLFVLRGSVPGKLCAWLHAQGMLGMYPGSGDERARLRGIRWSDCGLHSVCPRLAPDPPPRWCWSRGGLAGPKGYPWLSVPWWVGASLPVVIEPLLSHQACQNTARQGVITGTYRGHYPPLAAVCDTRPVSSAFAPLRGLISIPALKQNYPHCSLQDVINFNLGPKDSTMGRPSLACRAQLTE